MENIINTKLVENSEVQLPKIFDIYLNEFDINLFKIKFYKTLSFSLFFSIIIILIFLIFL